MFLGGERDEVDYGQDGRYDDFRGSPDKYQGEPDHDRSPDDGPPDDDNVATHDIAAHDAGTTAAKYDACPRDPGLFADDGIRQLLPGRGVLLGRRSRCQRDNSDRRADHLRRQQRMAVGAGLIA